MIPRLTLASNFRWSFVGNLVHAGCQWGMVAVLARLGTAEEVGKMVLGAAITAPIMALTMLQLRNVQATDAREQYHFADYLGLRMVTTVIAMALIAVSAATSDISVSTFWVVLIVGMTKSSDGLNDLVRGLFQQEERMDFAGISLALRGAGGLLSMILAYLASGSIVVALSAAMIVRFLMNAAYDAPYASRLLSQKYRASTQGESNDWSLLTPRFTTRVMLGLTWTALPLGIVMALVSLQTSLPRYALSGYGGEKELGIFGLLAYPLVAGTMVTGALGQSASPRLAKYFLNDRAAYCRLLGKMALISLGLGLASILVAAALGRPVLTLIYGAEYADYQKEFVIIAVAGAVQLIASPFGYAMTAARAFRMQAVIVTFSCLATAAASLWLVPERGIAGASIAVVVTGACMLAGFAAGVAIQLRRPVAHVPSENQTADQKDATRVD